MSIVFPLALPASPTTRQVRLRQVTTVGESRSPFTGSAQLYQWPGEWWEYEASLPPLTNRADAEAWITFLMKLRGKSGQFLAGDPGGRSPRGSVALANSILYPQVLGSAAPGSTSRSLSTVVHHASNVLMAGDYLQIQPNYITAPQDMQNASWSAQQCSATSSTRVSPSVGATDAALVSPYFPAIGGQTYLLHVMMKAASGSPTISIGLQADGYATRGQASCALVSGNYKSFIVSATLAPTDTEIRAVLGGFSSWPYADGPVDIIGASLCCPNGDCRLYKVLGDASASGDTAVVDIFPRVREQITDYSVVITSNSVGRFRLSDNKFEWDTEWYMHRSMSFKAVEVL